MYSDEIDKLEGWFAMLNTPEFNGTDAGMVRDEMAKFLVDFYKMRLGIKHNALSTKEEIQGGKS